MGYRNSYKLQSKKINKQKQTLSRVIMCQMKVQNLSLLLQTAEKSVFCSASERNTNRINNKSVDSKHLYNPLYCAIHCGQRRGKMKILVATSVTPQPCSLVV